MIGKINSIESMGLVDGPGVRFVVFMQGCPLRCIYCHNPESWNINYKNASHYTPQLLVNKILRYKEYFNKNGGVTFSGGEPLMQKEFLLQCLKLLKENNINTCIDTSGAIPNCNDILKYTDLVILDIKATNKEKYKFITNYDIKYSLDFLKNCIKLKKRLWIRSVIVPGINDNINYINELISFLKSYKHYIDKIELLPYHTYAIEKYINLNIEYKLKDVPDMDKKRCKELENMLKKGLEN